MHDITIQEINKRFWIPENLAECNRNQYLDMSKLILMYQMNELNKKQFRVLALYNLMNMEYSKADLENVEEEKWENVYVASQIIDTFFETDEEGRESVVLDYVHNPVKSVKYKMMTFVGPKDGLKDMTWKQFIEAIGELQTFSTDGKIEHLVNIFAMFYLRPRETFGKIDLERRVDFFKHLDIRYIYGFFLLFTSFWKFLRTQSVIGVDGREIDLRIMFEVKASDEEEVLPELAELGFRSTSYQLAESGVFGTLAELEQSNFWDVILRMYDMTVRNKKREAEMEAQKNENK